MSAVHRHRDVRVLDAEIVVVQAEGRESAVVGVKAASARERWRPLGERKERRGLGHYATAGYG